MSAIPGPFDFLRAITETKENLIVDDVTEKAYNAFMVNRGLSYHHDTVLLANEVNRLHHVDSKLKFSLLINSIRKRKRFSKWFKPETSEAHVIVKEYYGCNDEKARSILAILTQSQVDELKSRLDRGGKQSGRGAKAKAA
jgi:hypothetical protein